MLDLQYRDRDVGHLLGVWLVGLGVLLLSTGRPDYSPIVGSVGDKVIFGGLVGLVLIGMLLARYQDIALGVPIGICGALVVWSVLRTLAAEPLVLSARTASVAAGLLLVGGLSVREGLLIARGRRRDGRDTARETASPPRIRWGWWLGAGALLTAGIAGLL